VGGRDADVTLAADGKTFPDDRDGDAADTRALYACADDFDRLPTMLDVVVVAPAVRPGRRALGRGPTAPRISAS